MRLFFVFSALVIEGLGLLVMSLVCTWADILCDVGVYLFFILFKAKLIKV